MAAMAIHCVLVNLSRNTATPMTATAAKKTVKLSQVKKKAYLLPKAITISKAQGKVSYSNTSKAAKLKKFKVNA